MLIQDTIFYRPDWRWHNFLKYLTNNLSKYNCLEKKIPSEYSYKDSTYGSKKSKKNVNLSTWGVTHKKRIQFARAVCINSPNYSVLNFLIIPNTIYNVPFFGVDFVSLSNSYLIVLDFQPSLKIQNQYNFLAQKFFLCSFLTSYFHAIFFFVFLFFKKRFVTPVTYNFGTHFVFFFTVSVKSYGSISCPHKSCPEMDFS